MINAVNPLLCDPEQGACVIGDSVNVPDKPKLPDLKRVKLVYFTDPICSSCWGLESQLRRLKLEYGGEIEIEYRMGGLLRDWSYSSGGISKPSDVAEHWDEVSLYYDMPIDGDVWLEDPLHSSFPPSVAVKAAQIQDYQKSVEFLRYLREMVFLQKKNICKWTHISEAAELAGLNTENLKKDIDSAALSAFENDLLLSRQMGVRAFPSIFISGISGKSVTLVGVKPYTELELAVLSIDSLLVKQSYRKDWLSLFTYYRSLTAKEYSDLSGMPRKETELYLDKLVSEGLLTRVITKNGKLWSKSKSS